MEKIQSSKYHLKRLIKHFQQRMILAKDGGSKISVFFIILIKNLPLKKLFLLGDFCVKKKFLIAVS